MGSTDHLKDDQFFLNIPFSEVEFNAPVDVTWIRPAAQMSKLDYIGLYAKDDPDDAIPCNWEFAIGEEASGLVKLQMTNHGEMEIRYFDVAADRPRVKVPILVYEACSNNCTNHGVCEKGQCVCFSPYKGAECCEVGGNIAVDLNATTTTIGSFLHVTLTPPAGDLDKRNWIGLFRVGGQTESGIQILAATSSGILQDLPATTVDSGLDADMELLNITATPPLIWRYVNHTLDIPVPYVPGEYVLKVVKNVENHPVLGSSSIIYVHGECPNNCSGHGVCVNGTCVCNEGYNNTVDCSIGDGLVRLSVTPSDCTAGTIITVTWERNSDGGFSNLDYLALFDVADESFDAPFAYQFAQPQEIKVSPKIQSLVPPLAQNLLVTRGEPAPEKVVDRGVVEFNAPSAKSKFIVRYFKRDHTQFAVSPPIEVYFDCVVPDCTGHGSCLKGECVCGAEWKGADCSIGVGPITVESPTDPLVINTLFKATWSRPEKVGSIYDFVALYAHNAPNDQPFMYRYASNAEGEPQTHGEITLQMPSKPGLYEVRYVDAFSRETVAMTSTIEAHLPCPNTCSGHGTCQKDICICRDGWTARDDCSAKVGVTQITASPLKLETPSTDKITVTFSRPEGSGSLQDFIGLFPKAQTSNRHPIDFVVPPSDFGTVQFSAPHFPGLYQARYIGGSNSESRAHSVDIDVTKACLNKCSEHGVCNRGTCECSSGWESADCSVGQGPTSVTVGPHLGHPGDPLLITYTRPVNNGGPSDILGIYYKNSKDMSTPLGFVMATEKDHDTVEAKMPTVEAELEVHYVRGSDQKSVGFSAPFKVVYPCKDACNDHGDCKLGFCTCRDGFDGFACENSVPTAFKVALLSGASVAPLETISVFWEAVPKRSAASDLIALFATSDTANASPLVYEYTSMRVNGTASLMAPYQPGTYVAKYLGSYQGFAEVLAVSEQISVVVPPKTCKNDCSGHGTCDTTKGACLCEAGWGGDNCATKVPTDWAVSIDAAEYAPGFWIDARWTRPPVNTGNHNDIIGIFEPGKDQPVKYQYAGFGNEGKITLQAPTPSGAKQAYRLQFMNGASGQIMASSPTFNVVKGATMANKNKMSSRVHRADNV